MWFCSALSNNRIPKEWSYGTNLSSWTSGLKLYPTLMFIRSLEMPSGHHNEFCMRRSFVWFSYRYCGLTPYWRVLATRTLSVKETQVCCWQREKKRARIVPIIITVKEETHMFLHNYNKFGILIECHRFIRDVNMQIK